jgi:hypothetical protein
MRTKQDLNTPCGVAISDLVYGRSWQAIDAWPVVSWRMFLLSQCLTWSTSQSDWVKTSEGGGLATGSLGGYFVIMVFIEVRSMFVLVCYLFF